MPSHKFEKEISQKKLLSFLYCSNELYTSQKVENIIIDTTEVSLVQAEAPNYGQFLERPIEQLKEKIFLVHLLTRLLDIVSVQPISLSYACSTLNLKCPFLFSTWGFKNSLGFYFVLYEN